MHDAAGQYALLDRSAAEMAALGPGGAGGNSSGVLEMLGKTRQPAGPAGSGQQVEAQAPGAAGG